MISTGVGRIRQSRGVFAPERGIVSQNIQFYLSRVLLLVGHETDELSLSHMTLLIQVMTPFCSHMTRLSSHMTHAYMESS